MALLIIIQFGATNAFTNIEEEEEEEKRTIQMIQKLLLASLWNVHSNSIFYGNFTDVCKFNFYLKEKFINENKSIGICFGILEKYLLQVFLFIWKWIFSSIFSSRKNAL